MVLWCFEGCWLICANKSFTFGRHLILHSLVPIVEHLHWVLIFQKLFIQHDVMITLPKNVTFFLFVFAFMSLQVSMHRVCEGDLVTLRSVVKLSVYHV